MARLCMLLANAISTKISSSYLLCKCSLMVATGFKSVETCFLLSRYQLNISLSNLLCNCSLMAAIGFKSVICRNLLSSIKVSAEHIFIKFVVQLFTDGGYWV